MLIHEYSGGRLPIYHFDFFRIEDRPSAERLGLDDYFFGDGVSIIEWADRFPDLIPEKARWIAFETKSETQRAITAKRKFWRSSFPAPAEVLPASAMAISTF